MEKPRLKKKTHRDGETVEKRSYCKKIETVRLLGKPRLQKNIDSKTVRKAQIEKHRDSETVEKKVTLQKNRDSKTVGKAQIAKET